jgi:glycosyltransferase involved in cell wall biosynthesis
LLAISLSLQHMVDHNMPDPKQLHALKNDSLNRVAFCYHFFPHYRKGIIEEIYKELPATFIGDSTGVEGIKTFQFPKNVNFIPAKCIYIGKVMIQPRVLWESITGDYTTYVFLANPNHLTTWLAAGICRLRKKRVVFWGHGFKSSIPNKSNIIRKYFFSLAHAFYTYGFNAKKNAISFGFSAKYIHVGFNSLDYESQLVIRNHLTTTLTKDELPPNNLTISCISRLTYTCRYDILFDAIAQARDSSPINFNVVIIGDGPERAKLEAKAKELSLNVNFLGSVYEEQKIAKVLYQSDVTISPGKIGLTAMHSLMYGTPVISHDDIISQMPEVEAVVTGFTGELFRSGDTKHLAEILISFPTRFPNRNQTRKNCFAMIDSIYNPIKQIEILKMIINDVPASNGDDAFTLFEEGVKK